MKKIPPDSIRKLLIRAPNWLGDAVMCLPALDCITSGFPHAAVFVLAPENLSMLFDGNRRVHSVIPLTRKGTRSLLGNASRLKKENFDMAVLFPNSFGSALMTAVARIKIRAGYPTDGRRFLLTHTIKKDPHIAHHSEYYINIAKGLTVCTDTGNVALTISDADRNEGLRLLKENGIDPEGTVIAIAPGAAYGEAKRWPSERFSAVAGKIAHTGLGNVVVLGTPEEANIANEVCEGTGAVNLCGKTTLRQLAGLLSLCKVLITNDTGTMHLASAAGTSVVAVFGSTDEKMTAPMGKRKIIKGDADCSPCFRRTCDRGMVCMLAVTVHEVFDAVCAELKE